MKMKWYSREKGSYVGDKDKKKVMLIYTLQSHQISIQWIQ